MAATLQVPAVDAPAPGPVLPRATVIPPPAWATQQWHARLLSLKYAPLVTETSISPSDASGRTTAQHQALRGSVATNGTSHPRNSPRASDTAPCPRQSAENTPTHAPLAAASPVMAPGPSPEVAGAHVDSVGHDRTIAQELGLVDGASFIACHDAISDLDPSSAALLPAVSLDAQLSAPLDPFLGESFGAAWNCGALAAPLVGSPPAPVLQRPASDEPPQLASAFDLAPDAAATRGGGGATAPEGAARAGEQKGAGGATATAAANGSRPADDDARTESDCDSAAATHAESLQSGQPVWPPPRGTVIQKRRSPSTRHLGRRSRAPGAVAAQLKTAVPEAPEPGAADGHKGRPEADSATESDEVVAFAAADKPAAGDEDAKAQDKDAAAQQPGALGAAEKRARAAVEAKAGVKADETGAQHGKRLVKKLANGDAARGSNSDSAASMEDHEAAEALLAIQLAPPPQGEEGGDPESAPADAGAPKNGAPEANGEARGAPGGGGPPVSKTPAKVSLKELTSRKGAASGRSRGAQSSGRKDKKKQSAAGAQPQPAAMMPDWSQANSDLLGMLASINGPLSNCMLAPPAPFVGPAHGGHGLASFEQFLPVNAPMPVQGSRRSRQGSAEDEAAAGMGVESRQSLEACYHLPINEAAEKLGIGVTLLKKVCRVYGIARWPQRKLSSLDKLIQPLEEFLGQNPHDLESATTLRRLKAQRDLIFKHPNEDLDDFAKKLRQATLKAQHMLRRPKGGGAPSMTAAVAAAVVASRAGRNAAAGAGGALAQQFWPTGDDDGALADDAAAVDAAALAMPPALFAAAPPGDDAASGDAVAMAGLPPEFFGLPPASLPFPAAADAGLDAAGALKRPLLAAFPALDITGSGALPLGSLGPDLGLSGNVFPSLDLSLQQALSMPGPSLAPAQPDGDATSDHRASGKKRRR